MGPYTVILSKVHDLKKPPLAGSLPLPSASFYVDRYGRLYPRGSDSSNTGQQRQNTSGGWEGSVFDALPSLVEQGCGRILQKKARQLHSARGSFDQATTSRRGARANKSHRHSGTYRSLMYILMLYFLCSFVSLILGFFFVHEFQRMADTPSPSTPVHRSCDFEGLKRSTAPQSRI